ncbi:(deoxy)nucleoside triphosphate pyrophosphohydrolase [Candidatus Omnitrophota bacterium]
MSPKKELEVVAAIIERGGKVLLCQRRADDAFALLWEFPGGTVEKNESQQEALRREIKEELDSTIEVGPLVEVFSDEIPSLKIYVHLYKVVRFQPEPRPIECAALGFFDFEEAGRLDLAPVDAKIVDYLRRRKEQG